MDLELRQVVLVLGKEFVGHLADLCQRKDCRGQGIVTDGVVDHGRVAGQGGGDRHLLDTARELGQQGALRRQRTDMDGMEAGLIHIDRQLHAGAFGQVGDELRVGDVAVELEGFAALEGIDDIGGIFQPS